MNLNVTTFGNFSRSGLIVLERFIVPSGLEEARNTLRTLVLGEFQLFHLQATQQSAEVQEKNVKSKLGFYSKSKWIFTLNTMSHIVPQLISLMRITGTLWLYIGRIWPIMRTEHKLPFVSSSLYTFSSSILSLPLHPTSQGISSVLFSLFSCY